MIDVLSSRVAVALRRFRVRLPGTRGGSYDPPILRERRDTFVNCLVATAVLLMVIMAILLLIFISVGLREEDHDILSEETPRGNPRVLNPQIVVGTVQTMVYTTGKLVLMGVLLCTVRVRSSIRTFVYPEDGVCAITMFSSLFESRGNTLTPPYKDDLMHFLDTASHHRKTQYGFGIDHENETLMSTLIANPTTKTYLDDMWSHRVYHYGQVNTPPILKGISTLQYVTQSAKGLQMISQLMNDNVDPTRQPSYTVLHYPLIYEWMAADVAKALTSYPVDLLVAFGYTAYSDYGKKNCRVVPPVLHSTELLDSFLLNDTYPVRLVRVMSALVELKKQQTIRTELAVSLGMGGRWYVPALPDNAVGTPGNYPLGHRCTTVSGGDAPPRNQISSIVEACEDPNYNQTFSYDNTFQAMFAFDKSDRTLFTYDSAASLRFKLCETKKKVTDLRYNLVADDIQYEDIDDLCGYGSYSRLRLLNRLALFLAKNYTSPRHESACKLLT
ncbi:hypothetical protein HPB50_007447 [Hyalomma asiaticum]|uniref:Uncharacterized protein n=1 Tax=Hyalomma asiaticum TaxID=266040 RepID=A0ACB7SPE3_HYAAI|nr:hypothetical protein HPB50_007447 [Hyalomma asiaticum]